MDMVAGSMGRMLPSSHTTLLPSVTDAICGGVVFTITRSPILILNLRFDPKQFDVGELSASALNFSYGATDVNTVCETVLNVLRADEVEPSDVLA
jgi:hypothetical protein